MDTGGGATHNEQDYGYDAVGNMWATSNLGSKLPASPDTPASAGAYRSGNHLNGVNYDAAGSQTTDPAMCPTTSCIQYDAENRQVVFGTNYYQYDGEGRRVVSATTSGTTIYVYDAEGKGAAEYASSLPTPVCSTCFLTTDHLGSTRLVTDQNANVIARHDYMPFGQELINGYAGRSAQYGASDLVSQKFTGKERDAESGLDYFGARYYGSSMGRFTSPDDPLVDQDPSDPQSWNLYGYVRNNPLRNVDQTGRSCVNLDNGLQADNGDGQGCSGAGVSAGNSNDPSTLSQGQVNAQVTAQQGSWLAAVGTNAFLSMSNAANSFFSFISPDSQLLSQTPTGQGSDPNIGAGIGLAATLIGPGGEAEGAAKGAGIWSKGVKNAFQHWIKHGREFPSLQNAKQYVEAAQEFVTNPPLGTLSKLRANGDTVLYNPSTNTFAVRTAEGAPRTMFKPNNGSTYFNAQ